ncbi:ArdC family protein [Salmonella enterica]|uniref:ArdC family protein n=1 Tax=Salmonella enterica TaxID=28901 RepID=UPI0009ADD444|nr:ArdC family protein [Salmonella enterica]
MNTPLHPDDISRFITGRIIDSLAAGLVPWHGTVPGLPEHALTGEPFTGVNVLLLWQAMQQRSLHSGRWLAGLDTLSKAAEQPDWLPRVHPHSSGQCDLLLKGNPTALTEADEETYLRVTGQQDLPVHRRIPQATFSKTVRYWHRFETWLAEQLQDITQHCYRKLCRFVANATTEPRLLHEYRGEYGSLRLFVGPQNIDEIDILEFNPEYIVSWVDKVADGVFTPVCFAVNVHYKNGILLESFTWDSEVDNINRLTSSDYGEAMSQAISWVREQFEQPVIDQPVPQQPRLAA